MRTILFILPQKKTNNAKLQTMNASDILHVLDIFMERDRCFAVERQDNKTWKFSFSDWTFCVQYGDMDWGNALLKATVAKTTRFAKKMSQKDLQVKEKIDRIIEKTGRFEVVEFKVAPPQIVWTINGFTKGSKCWRDSVLSFDIPN